MKLDKKSAIPLYMQIRDSLRTSIADGSLAPGARLATVAAMAQEFEVTQATIRRAIQDLVTEGLVSAHVGRGTFVSGAEPVGESFSQEAQTNDEGLQFRRGFLPGGRESEHYLDSRASIRAAQRLRRSVSRGLNELVSAALRPGCIAFTSGTGDPETVEEGTLTRLAQLALAGGERVFLDYGDPRGLASLRSSIAALYERRGLTVSSDEILVTSGSQQALAIVAQAAAEDGAPMILETPCYSGVTNAFSAASQCIETLVRGEEGPDPAHIPPGTPMENAVLYFCPYLHNPTGTNCSSQLLDSLSLWARKHRALLVSDEVFRDLCFEDEGSSADTGIPGSILARAGLDHTVLVASLSKSFISGLRVGWIVSAVSRINRYVEIKRAMDLSCPPLMQGIAKAFLDEEDGYAAHRRRACEHYRLRRDTLLQALEEYMPDAVTWTIPDGGFQLQLSLPRGFSSVELLLRGSEHGVAFLPGPLQDLNQRFVNTARLCYGSLSPEQIREGARRLALACDEYLTEGPSETGMTGLGDY